MLLEGERSMSDFWLSSGYHLLDRDPEGRLCVSDEFMKAYLARPELAPPHDACIVERTLHAALLSDPWRSVGPAEIALIADADARENWQFMIALRDRFATHRTIEETYKSLVRENVRLPLLFLDQLVQLILRNALDGCGDAFVLRAAELLFRPQRLTVHEESLLAADQEHLDSQRAAVSPLAAMFGEAFGPQVEVLSEANALHYWARSDRFDFALDLTRQGRAALATVLTRWLNHLQGLDVAIEPIDALHEAVLSWYVGLDAQGTRTGDALWHGLALDDATRSRVVALFRLSFYDTSSIIEHMIGEDVYLILAMGADGILRMKPQNLLTGLPLKAVEMVS